MLWCFLRREQSLWFTFDEPCVRGAANHEGVCTACIQSRTSCRTTAVSCTSYGSNRAYTRHECCDLFRAGLSGRVVLSQHLQVAKLRAELSTVDRCRREEDAAATIKLRSATRQADELKAQLARVQSEAAEQARQLVRHRDEVFHFFFFVETIQEATLYGRDADFPRGISPLCI